MPNKMALLEVRTRRSPGLKCSRELSKGDRARTYARQTLGHEVNPRATAPLRACTRRGRVDAGRCRVVLDRRADPGGGRGLVGPRDTRPDAGYRSRYGGAGRGDTVFA